MKQYLIRLDDACSTMNFSKWRVIEEILDKYHIAPLVGIVPSCEDQKLMIGAEDPSFWERVFSWSNKGWAIALHGYNHVYSSTAAGINPLWNRSEFAGLSLDEQREKIRRGIDIMKKNHIDPQYFFAPSHTFDNNTLIALKKESNIRIISDTIAFEAYRKDDFIIIPCQLGHFRSIPFAGTWTFCFHPNMMNETDIKTFDEFIYNNRDFFYSFDKIDLCNVKGKSLSSKLLSFIYFTYRKVRGLK